MNPCQGGAGREAGDGRGSRAQRSRGPGCARRCQCDEPRLVFIAPGVRARVTGLTDFSPKPWPVRFRELQAAGGHVEIVQSRVQQGDLVAVAAGTLGLSANGRLDGELQMTVAGIEKVIPALGIDNALDASMARDIGTWLVSFAPNVTEASVSRFVATRKSFEWSARKSFVRPEAENNRARKVSTARLSNMPVGIARPSVAKDSIAPRCNGSRRYCSPACNRSVGTVSRRRRCTKSAVVPAACDILYLTPQSPKRDRPPPARGECERLAVSHVGERHARRLRAVDRRRP